MVRCCVIDMAFEDHNYCIQTKAAAKECVIYYICGYLCKQILKHTNCKVCLNALKGSFMFILLIIYCW